jgi:hypothetical protein
MVGGELVSNCLIVFEMCMFMSGFKSNFPYGTFHFGYIRANYGMVTIRPNYVPNRG